MVVSGDDYYVSLFSLLRKARVSIRATRVSRLQTQQKERRASNFRLGEPAALLRRRYPPILSRKTYATRRGRERVNLLPARSREKHAQPLFYYRLSCDESYHKRVGPVSFFSFNPPSTPPPVASARPGASPLFITILFHFYNVFINIKSHGRILRRARKGNCHEG